MTTSCRQSRITDDSEARGVINLADIDTENNAANLGLSVAATSRIDEDEEDEEDEAVTDADGDGTNDVRAIVARFATKVDGTGDNAVNQLDVSNDDVGEGTTIRGKYGTLTLTGWAADHGYDWAYALENGWDSVQNLNAGQVVTDVFTVTVTDAHGVQSDTPITITITGSNDRPVITVTGDDADGADGTFGTDDDRLAGHADATEAGHGVDTIDATGTLTFTDIDTEHDPSGDLSADFDFLIAAASTSAVDTTDDSAILDANGNPTVTRKADAALGDDFTVNPGADGGLAVSGLWGSLTIAQATGAWTYAIDNDNRGRGAGPGRDDVRGIRHPRPR